MTMVHASQWLMGMMTLGVISAGVLMSIWAKDRRNQRLHELDMKAAEIELEQTRQPRRGE